MTVDPGLFTADEREFLMGIQADGGFLPLDPFAPSTIEAIPSFPLDAFPEPARAFIAAVSRSYQTDPAMVAGFVLGAVNACISGVFRIHIHADWYEESSLFILVVAESGGGKSGVQKVCTKPLTDEEKEFNKLYSSDIAAYTSKVKIAAENVQRLEKQAACGKADFSEVQAAIDERVRLEQEERITAKSIFTTNCTPEKLSSLIAQNGGRYAVISSEGSGIFSNAAGLYSNGQPEASVFLCAHDGDEIRVDRIGREPDYIEKPALSMCLGIQPGVLSKFLKNEYFMQSGFNQRLLFLFPKDNTGKRVFKSEPIPEPVRNAYSGMVRGLARFEPTTERYTIEFTPEALNVFESFYNSIETRLNEDLHGIRGWANKYRGTVARIALCLHCMSVRNPVQTVIDADTLRNAIRIGEYLLETAKAVFDGAEEKKADEDAKYILERIQGTGKTELSKHEIIRLCQRFKRDPEALKAGMDELTRRGYITVDKVQAGGRGRPGEVVRVNPAA